MASWVPEWVQDMYAYMTGARRGRRNHRSPSPSTSSTPPASVRAGKKITQAGNQEQRNGILGVQGARVTKRTPNSKSSASKRPHKKTGATRTSKANNEDEASSVKITAAEQAAVNEENSMEAPEHLDRDNPRYNAWTDPEIILFNQLQDRGLEALLSTSFKLDFPTLPDEVFTDHDEETFINSRKGHDLHAIRALQSLFKVGGRIRARLAEKRHASDILLRVINAYIKWAMEDANIVRRDVLPILTVKASRANEDHIGAIKRTRAEVNRLAVRHRERYNNAIDAFNASSGKEPVYPHGSLNNSGPRNLATAIIPDVPGAVRPPVLFGIIIVKGVMSFTSLDASVEDAELKVVAVFDWAQSGQDVWNALAVAILVVMVRNYQAGVGGTVVEGAEGSDDPDA